MTISKSTYFKVLFKHLFKVPSGAKEMSSKAGAYVLQAGALASCDSSSAKYKPPTQ